MPRRRTQQERTARTQQTLTQATLEALVDAGYGGASTTEICRRAGASRGAMLHHYPTKADLMAAAVEQLFELRHEQFQAGVANLRGSERPLHDALMLVWAIYAGDTMQAWLELVVAGRSDPELSERLREVDARIFEQVRDTCARLVPGEPPVDGFARMVLTFFDGLALHHALSGDCEEREAALEEFEGLVRHWLAAR